MRLPPLIARLALGCAFITAIVVGGCRGGSSTDGTLLADRWLRIGEDLGTAVDVYEGALPPDFASLLNSGVTATADDQIALPVHPDGTLLGSFHLRRPDGSNLVWLIFDVPGGDLAAHDVIAGQLDQSPWQVVGGQSSASITVVRFQSTRNGNIDGTAVIQPLPESTEFALEVERAGKRTTLRVARSAPSPLIEADLVERDRAVSVRRVDGGAVAAAGLAVDDRIVAVDGTAVQTLAELDQALRGLVTAGGPAVSLVYILDFGATQAPRQPTFVLPPSRSLPADFPATFLVDDAMTVLDVSWASQGGQGTAYQATLLTKTDVTTQATTYRDALRQQGWQITNDQAIGFATQLDFTSADGSLAGRASIDSFTDDPSLTSVSLQIQSSPASGG